MGEQETDQIGQEEVKETKLTIINYDFGDLYMKCKCGHEDLLVEGLECGIRFDIFTTDTHNVKFGCSKCGALLTLYFKEAKNIELLRAAKAEKERLQEEELIKKQLESEVVEEIKDESGEV